MPDSTQTNTPSPHRGQDYQPPQQSKVIKDARGTRTLKKTFWEDVLDYFLCVLGGIIYSVALNLLILPAGLYIGNMTGIARIIVELLQKVIPNFRI